MSSNALKSGIVKDQYYVPGLYVVVGVLLVLGAAAPAASPKYAGRHMLSNLVTDDCLVFTTIPSPKDTLDAVRLLSPCRLMNDPEVQAFIRSGEESLDKALSADFRTSAADIRADIADYLQLFDRQLSLAVYDSRKRTQDIVVLLESSREGGAVKKWLDGMVRDKVFERYTAGGARRIKIAETEAFVCDAMRGWSPALCARGSLLIIAGSQERLAKTLAALDRPPKNALAEAEVFQRARRAVGAGGAHFFFFMNLARIWKLALDEDPDDEDLATARKVLGFEFVAAAVTFEGNRAFSRVHVVPETGQKETLLSYVARSPNPFDTLELIPNRAVLFASIGLHPRKIIKRISENEDFFEEAAMPDAAERAATKKLWEQALNALAGSLKEETSAFVQLPFGGGMWPEAALVSRTRDPAALEQHITDLLKLAGKPAEPKPFLDTNIYVIAETGGIFPVAPTVAVVGRNMVMSYTPQTVRMLIRQKQQRTGLLRDKPEFKEALSQVADDRVGVVFLDMRSLLLFIYNASVPLLAAVERETGDGGPLFDSALLPTTETLAQYFSEMLISAHWQGEGLTMRIASDGFDPASLAMHAQVFAPYYLPLAFLAHRKQMAAECRWKLYMPYARKETDLPATQNEFIQKHRHRKSLVCPADPKPVDLGDGFKTSYEYFPEKYGVKMRIGPESGTKTAAELAPPMASRDTIILYDNKPRHRRGRNVMTPGGRKWMSEEEFQKRLAKQIAQFKNK